MLDEGDVLAVGARLLVLQGIAAALVALVVDLALSQPEEYTSALWSYLCILALLHRLLHGL